MSADNVQDLLQALRSSPRNRCFACGPGNPHGLHLKLDREDHVVRTHFVPGEWHEGWAGVVHGGILVTLLDEAMAYTLFYAGIKSVTARMEVRYRRPAHQGDRLVVEAKIVADGRKVTDIEGRVSRGGEVIAEASGRFMKLGELTPDMLE